MQDTLLLTESEYLTLTQPSRGIVPEGKACAGDLVRLPCGEVREVVSVMSAGVYLDLTINDRMALCQNSSTSLLMAFGETEGREKRDWELERKRLRRSVRRAA